MPAPYLHRSPEGRGGRRKIFPGTSAVFPPETRGVRSPPPRPAGPRYPWRDVRESRTAAIPGRFKTVSRWYPVIRTLLSHRPAFSSRIPGNHPAGRGCWIPSLNTPFTQGISTDSAVTTFITHSPP